MFLLSKNIMLLVMLPFRLDMSTREPFVILIYYSINNFVLELNNNNHMIIIILFQSCDGIAIEYVIYIIKHI
jgi:hypothetical protein